MYFKRATFIWSRGSETFSYDGFNCSRRSDCFGSVEKCLECRLHLEPAFRIFPRIPISFGAGIQNILVRARLEPTFRILSTVISFEADIHES